MAKKIYMASKVKHAPMWRAFRDQGQPIISTWIDEDEPGQTVDYGDLAVRCIQEAASCDVLILFCFPDETLKGALFEAGAALAAGTSVISVGQCENWSTTFAQHPLWREADGLDMAFRLASSEEQPDEQ